MKSYVVICLAFAVSLSLFAEPALVPMPRQMSVEGAVDRGPLPPEGYLLEVGRDGAVKIEAADAAGHFYAERTLEQLKADAPAGVVAPVTIRDWPEFRWRGIHLDESRHFFGKVTVKRLIETMSRFKLNVLHWHIIDDSGWRLEIPGYPKLTQEGATRKAKKGFNWLHELEDGPYGPFFYTEADVKEILAFAATRHVRVIPEVELPGHSAHILKKCCPEYACDPKNPGGVFCLGNEAGMKFLEHVVTYVADLFPDSYIHIGGDEVNKSAWAKCEKCQALASREKLGSTENLQRWVTKRFADILAAKDKKAVGWDEVLCESAPKNLVVMDWCGTGRGNAAVAAGLEVVRCPHFFCYFDYDQCVKGDKVPYPDGVPPVPVSKVYSYDPYDGVAAKDRKFVIGGQCNNWTEWTCTQDELEWKVWPRAGAIAEVFWSCPAKRDYASFAKRLAVRRDELVRHGVNAAPVGAEDGINVVPRPKKAKLTLGSYTAATNVVCEAIGTFARDASLPPEGYAISITWDKGIAVRHADAAGKCHALETLKQLARPSPMGKLHFSALEIEDSPAYRWRGVMLDEGRHFFGVNAVKELLDEMAKVKLNVFHWHLTEDQGWRLDVPGYPELVRVGAVRPSSAKVWTENVPDGVPYGPFYYTPGQVKEILAYAKAHEIRVVPEIELPGHIRALLAAHPEFSCTGKVPPVTPFETGVLEDVLCVGNDAAIRYLEGVLAAVAKMFPDEVLHIGGDEAPDKRWQSCPKCQARMKKEGLTTTAELQGWCTAHFAKFLKETCGKRTMGWDEIAAAKVPAGTILQYWRSGGWFGGAQSGINAAVERALGEGAELVASPLDRTYFSLPPDDVETAVRYRSPLSHYAPSVRISLEKAYGFDPAALFPAKYRDRVIGGECCNWSEGTTDPTALRAKLWPRAAATAEALWTAPVVRDAEDLKRRRLSR